MGDRGNIIVKDGESTVYLYTHWTGSDLPETLKGALSRGKDRWDDGLYLTRVIFQDMIGNDKDITGFGISSVYGDGGTDLRVDIDKQTVDGVPFADFIKG